MPSLSDRIAAYVGIWALQMLFWPPCETDGRDGFLHDPSWTVTFTKHMK